MYSIIKKVKNMSAIFKNLCYNYFRINERGKIMPKIRIKAMLIGNETNHNVTGKGILQNDKIIYQETGLQVVIEKKDNQVILKRSCKEYELVLPFTNNEKTSGVYKIIEYSMILDAEIYTKKLVMNNQEIKITYELTLGGEFLGEYTYDLVYEVIK